MDGNQIEGQFHRMGARIAFVQFGRDDIRVDVRRDRHGEFFDVLAGDGIRIVVPDVRPDMRHLFMVAQVLRTGEKHRFLCGHDEREWFAAAVPSTRGVSGVRTAMQALMPQDVRNDMARLGVRGREFASRKTAAYRRQGEWFFLPREKMVFDAAIIRRNEPFNRGRGKSHFADYAVRIGGEAVMVSDRAPQGVTPEQHRILLRANPLARKWGWREGRRNPDLYVRGRIRHPDHATITLDCWNLVRMNTESQAPAMKHLAFID